MILTEKGYLNFSIRKPVNLKVDDQELFKAKEVEIILSELNKKKSIEQWIKLLPELRHLEYLWIHHQLNQEMFESICKLPNLKGLNIKWSNLDSITSIANLTELEHLTIGSSPKITNIEILPELNKLKTLSLENFKNVVDFKPLSKMSKLLGLGLNGGMYDRLNIETLEPIGNLTELIFLQLISTSVKDKSIKPLLNLKKLQSLWLTNKWTEADFELLRSNLPLLKFGNVVPDDNIKRINKIFEKKK